LVPFLVIAAVILIAICFLLFFQKEKSGNWIQFNSKGKEAGFTTKDLEQLRRIAAGCDIKDPSGIFSSQSQFEIVVRSMVKTLQLSGEGYDPENQYFLSRLFDYCHKIGMEAIEIKTRITNSHQISEGQMLRILVTGTGVFKSEIVKNAGNYLTISRPVSAKSNSALQWQGIKISVYFWREDDAGYVFDTEVIDEVFSKGISSLKVEHNDSLFRTQKRKSMRLKTHKPAFIYLLNDTDNPHSLEKTAGLRCILEDISDAGCAFKVHGQVETGMRLKVQFSLNKIPVCIPATVRSVEYREDTNTSLVHTEADPLPIATRNHILCEVFNMQPDDEDELPFRILEGEVDSSASQPLSNEMRKNFNEVMNG